MIQEQRSLFSTFNGPPVLQADKQPTLLMLHHMLHLRCLSAVCLSTHFSAVCLAGWLSVNPSVCCLQGGGFCQPALTSRTPSLVQAALPPQPVSACKEIPPELHSQATARCEPSAAAAAPAAVSGHQCTLALAATQAATQAAMQAAPAAAAAARCWGQLRGRRLRKVWMGVCWWAQELSAC
jgi:hypothetical protein